MVSLLWMLIGLSLYWVYDDFLLKCLKYPVWARIIHGTIFIAAFSVIAHTIAKTLGV